MPKRRLLKKPPEPLPYTVNHRGERVMLRSGAILAVLPEMLVPCPGEPDKRGAHDPRCICLGRGLRVVQRGSGHIAPTDDDGLDALFRSLAAPKAVGDKYLGDWTKNLMQPPDDGTKRGTGGRGGGRKRTKVVSHSRMRDFDAHPGTDDGRVESGNPCQKRSGGQTRFGGEPRRKKLKASFTRRVMRCLRRRGNDPDALLNWVLNLPEHAYAMNEARARLNGLSAGPHAMAS